jgi:hypothetical protein
MFFEVHKGLDDKTLRAPLYKGIRGTSALEGKCCSLSLSLSHTHTHTPPPPPPVIPAHVIAFTYSGFHYHIHQLFRGGSRYKPEYMEAMLYEFVFRWYVFRTAPCVYVGASALI